MSFNVSEQGQFLRIEFDDGQVSIVDPAHVAIATAQGGSLQLWFAGGGCWSITGGEEGHAERAVGLILAAKWRLANPMLYQRADVPAPQPATDPGAVCAGGRGLLG